ncbi:uncharacterized protein LOC106159331 isoform X2 [Lingula anatina]|nr:uncharacterized protein LOC106159331 isoform X2 [Lingula anatina]|eukprot:XP_013391048.1 uncharacterized protein LOC106159331 isoform X2 [Lingula anatina]
MRSIEWAMQPELQQADGWYCTHSSLDGKTGWLYRIVRVQEMRVRLPCRSPTLTFTVDCDTAVTPPGHCALPLSSVRRYPPPCHVMLAPELRYAARLLLASTATQVVADRNPERGQ